MQNKIFYILSIILLIISYSKDKTKTKIALLKSWKSFINILPQMLGIITSVGLIIAFLNPQVISRIIGNSSGYLGVTLAAVVGSITLIPGFIAFPTSCYTLRKWRWIYANWSFYIFTYDGGTFNYTNRDYILW